MTDPEPPQRWQLVLEAQPDNVPAIVRLRAALKRLLRSYGIRCVAIQQAGQEAPAAPPGRADEQDDLGATHEQQNAAAKRLRIL